MKEIKDCPTCAFDGGGDCTNKKWAKAIDRGEPTEDKNRNCLFWFTGNIEKKAHRKGKKDH